MKKQIEPEIMPKQPKNGNGSKTNKEIENEKFYWAGFYKKPFSERMKQELIIYTKLKQMDPGLVIENFETGGLTLSHAELMVENCIGKVSLPLGLGLNFLINGKYFTIPMCVEEPSVIAAASSSAKFISENGSGFLTSSTSSIMIGQIQILDHSPNDIAKLLSKKSEIIDKCNFFCQNMVSRGGGALDIRCRELEKGKMMVLEVLLDVCESMGANIVNTVLEKVSPTVQELVDGRIGIRILSNLCSERRAIAKFEVPVEKMKWKEISGEDVSRKILEAFNFAQLDIFRATTHNKGIMNGVDAVAIATGQDWRAIESACHAYAMIKFGHYQPLSHYSIITRDKQDIFIGSLELPLSVGTKGGVLGSNDLYNTSLRLLDFPSAKMLSEIMVAVGLAQNFAALRSLAIEGIQKGHMALHAKNIAMSVGTPAHLVEDVVNYMKNFNRISMDSAKLYLEAHELFANIRPDTKERKKPLSTFYVKIKPDNLEEPIVIHVAFDYFEDKNERPIHISIEKKKNRSFNPEIANRIFGEHDFEWLSNIFQMLEKLKITNAKEKIMNVNNSLNYKIKLLAILLNIISFNIMSSNSNKLHYLFENIKKEVKSNTLFDTKEILKNSDTASKYSMSLFCELYRVFIHTLKSTKTQSLRQYLINEMNLIIESNFLSHKLWLEADYQKFNFPNFLSVRKKRLCATMMLLSDLADWKITKIEQSFLDTILIFGSFVEKVGILAHDSKKFREKIEYNLFNYWKKYKNIDINDGNLEGFIADCREMVGKKREEILEIIKRDKTYLELYENVLEVLKKYYEFKNPEALRSSL